MLLQISIIQKQSFLKGLLVILFSAVNAVKCPLYFTSLLQSNIILIIFFNLILINDIRMFSKVYCALLVKEVYAVSIKTGLT